MNSWVYKLLILTSVLTMIHVQIFQAVDTWGTVDVLVNNAGTARVVFHFILTIPICFTFNE
jgi:hypothetical protein